MIFLIFKEDYCIFITTTICHCHYCICSVTVILWQNAFGEMSKSHGMYCTFVTYVKLTCIKQQQITVCIIQNVCSILGCFPDGKVHGANIGPILGRKDRGGPHVGPMNLAIWVHARPGMHIFNLTDKYFKFHQRCFDIIPHLCKMAVFLIFMDAYGMMCPVTATLWYNSFVEIFKSWNVLYNNYSLVSNNDYVQNLCII